MKTVEQVLDGRRGAIAKSWWRKGSSGSARAHSLADCARRRPCSAHSGLRGSSAARAV